MSPAQNNQISYHPSGAPPPILPTGGPRSRSVGDGVGDSAGGGDVGSLEEEVSDMRADLEGAKDAKSTAETTEKDQNKVASEELGRAEKALSNADRFESQAQQAFQMRDTLLTTVGMLEALLTTIDTSTPQGQAAAAMIRQQITSLKAQADKFNQEGQDLLDKAKAERDKAREHLSNAREALSKASEAAAEKNAKSEEIGKLESRISQLEQKIAELERRLEERGKQQQQAQQPGQGLGEIPGILDPMQQIRSDFADKMVSQAENAAVAAEMAADLAESLRDMAKRDPSSAKAHAKGARVAADRASIQAEIARGLASAAEQAGAPPGIIAALRAAAQKAEAAAARAQAAASEAEQIASGRQTPPKPQQKGEVTINASDAEAGTGVGEDKVGSDTALGTDGAPIGSGSETPSLPDQAVVSTSDTPALDIQVIPQN